MLPKIKQALSELIAPITSADSTASGSVNGEGGHFRPTKGKGAGFVRFGKDAQDSSSQQESRDGSNAENTAPHGSPDGSSNSSGERVAPERTLTLVKNPIDGPAFKGPSWQTLVGFLKIKPSQWLSRLGRSSYREILKKKSGTIFKKGSVVDRKAS